MRDGNGVPRYPDAPATLLDTLRTHVEIRPDAEAVVELGGDRLTYAQLWRRATRWPGGLRARGVRPGDRVAVRHTAGTDWALAFWGTVMAGGIAVAVNTRSAPPEVEFVLADAGVRADLSADAPLPDGDPYVATDPRGARAPPVTARRLQGSAVRTVVTEALPRNAGGKLLKNRLRDQVRWGDPLR